MRIPILNIVAIAEEQVKEELRVEGCLRVAALGSRTDKRLALGMSNYKRTKSI